MGKLRNNFIYQFGYQAVTIFLPLVISPYTSRVLGADGIGEYTYVNTVAYYFYIVGMLGFDTYGQRMIAERQNDFLKRSQAFSSLFITQLSVSIIVSCLYFIYTISLKGERQQIAIIQGIYVISASINIIWLFEGVEDFKKIAIRNILTKIISMILIFAFVNNRTDLWKYTLILSLSTLVSNCIYIVQIKEHACFTKIPKNAIKHDLLASCFLFLPQIAITLFMQTDKLMLGWWSSTRELGYYQNAEKIVFVPITIILTVGTVLMPRIAQKNSAGEKNIIKVLNSYSMNTMLILGIGSMFGLIAIARDLIPWFYGNDFVKSVKIMQLLTIIIVCMAWENVLQKQYLVPCGKDKIVMKGTILAAIINILINMMLIPKYNATGAIIGSIGAHLFLCIFEGYILKKELPIFKYIKLALLYLCSGTIMMICVKIVSENMYFASVFLKILFEIILGIVVYTLLIIYILKKYNPLFLKQMNIFFVRGRKKNE